jgi:hypothetical protein
LVETNQNVNIDFYEKCEETIVNFVLYSREQNLSKPELAAAAHSLLKGEALTLVEVHITADWNDAVYDAIRDSLDLKYGNPHVQAACITSRLKMILNLWNSLP